MTMRFVRFTPRSRKKPGHTPLSSLKLLKADPAAVAGGGRGDQGALFQGLQGLIDGLATNKKRRSRRSAFLL